MTTQTNSPAQAASPDRPGATAHQAVDTTNAAAVNAGDRVVIFDTTLRDGEQCPGASMTLDEKLRVAEMLERHRTAISSRSTRLPSGRVRR